MSTTPQTPLKTESVGQSVRTALKKFAKIAGVIVGIWLGVAVAIAGWESLDQNGYIPHDRPLDVSMTGNWMVGENRSCWLTLQHDGNGKPTGRPENLECPVGDEKMETHNISVTFKGNLSPMDMDNEPLQVADQWQCTRGNDGFTCVPMAHRSNPVNR